MLNFKSRKLQICLFGLAVATLGLVVGIVGGFLREANASPVGVSFDQWLEAFKWIAGIYAAGNVGEHFADANKIKAKNGGAA